MSYILDALRKAEQKRREGSVPDLQTIHAQVPGSSRKKIIWFYILTAVLVVNGGLLAWVGIQRQGSTPERMEKVAETPATGQEDLKKSESMRVVQASPPPPVSRPASTPPGPKAVGKKEVRSASIPSPGKREDSASQGTAEKVAARSKPTPGRPQAPASMPVREPKSMETGDSSALSSNPVVSSGQEDPHVWELSELPPGLRQGIPGLTLSLHFYARRPESRLVRINGRNLREGDTVTSGLVIDEITPEGVIFRVQGYRFEVPGLTVGH
jgi:general secretion pathway protein B